MTKNIDRETKLQLALLAPFLLGLAYGAWLLRNDEPWYDEVYVQQASGGAILAYYDPYANTLTKYPPLNPPVGWWKK